MVRKGVILKIDIFPSIESLNLVRELEKDILTIHQHHHILFDIAKMGFSEDQIVYIEIGCFAGASACLILQRPKTHVISIDVGAPISKENVMFAVNTHNPYNNRFDYIQGFSQEEGTKEALKSIITKIDILFIDGGHSREAVLNDFTMYQELVNPGGYIIFDDYNDFICSPEVKIAVDELLPTLENYQVIGTFSNILQAFPKDLTEGNCFIIRKKL